MGILKIDLNNINLGDTNYEEDDTDTIILVRLLAWHIILKKRTAFNKYDNWRINSNSVASYKMVELLSVRRWEKRNRSNFYWGAVKMSVGSIQ